MEKIVFARNRETEINITCVFVLILVQAPSQPTNQLTTTWDVADQHYYHGAKQK